MLHAASPTERKCRTFNSPKFRKLLHSYTMCQNVTVREAHMSKQTPVCHHRICDF